jgi:hypothetical protein
MRVCSKPTSSYYDRAYGESIVEEALRLADDAASKAPPELPPESDERVSEALNRVMDRRWPCSTDPSAAHILWTSQGGSHVNLWGRWNNAWRHSTRRAEARKVVPPKITVRDDPRRIEQRRTIEILQHRAALVKAGVFPFPERYADDLLAADYSRMPEN